MQCSRSHPTPHRQAILDPRSFLAATDPASALSDTAFLLEQTLFGQAEYGTDTLRASLKIPKGPVFAKTLRSGAPVFFSFPERFRSSRRLREVYNLTLTLTANLR
jgi:hypothetical protein